MLFDPKWEVQTKPDVFSLEGLIAWLEKQPADKTYNYWNCEGRCLYGQYTIAHGIPWHESGHFDEDTSRAEFCQGVYSNIACETPYTFGAALTRARAALAAQ